MHRVAGRVRDQMKMEARHACRTWGKNRGGIGVKSPVRRLRPSHEIRSTTDLAADSSAERSATREKHGCTVRLSMISPLFRLRLSTGPIVVFATNDHFMRTLYRAYPADRPYTSDDWGQFANDLNPPLATHQLPSLPLDSKTNKVRALNERAQALTGRVARPKHPASATVVDASGWAISAGISSAAGTRRRVPRIMPDAGACRRSDAAADPPVRL